MKNFLQVMNSPSRHKEDFQCASAIIENSFNMKVPTLLTLRGRTLIMNLYYITSTFLQEMLLSD